MRVKKVSIQRAATMRERTLAPHENIKRKVSQRLVSGLKVIRKFFLTITKVLDGISGITKNIFFFSFEGL